MRPPPPRDEGHRHRCRRRAAPCVAAARRAIARSHQSRGVDCGRTILPRGSAHAPTITLSLILECATTAMIACNASWTWPAGGSSSTTVSSQVPSFATGRARHLARAARLRCARASSASKRHQAARGDGVCCTAGRDAAKDAARRGADGLHARPRALACVVVTSDRAHQVVGRRRPLHC